MKVRREPIEVAAMLDALRAKPYAAPEWILLAEVPLLAADGEEGKTFADALAINTYPSRRLERHGFEVKRTREDWRDRERKHPEKSAPLRTFCHRMYLVVPCPWKNVLRDLAELDGRWGLYEVDGGRAVRVHPAPEPEIIPWEPTTHFLCSAFRAAQRAGERAVRAEGDAFLRTVADIDDRFAVLSPCGHRLLRTFSKKAEPRLTCFDCAEEAAAGPALASCPAPALELAEPKDGAA